MQSSLPIGHPCSQMSATQQDSRLRSLSDSLTQQNNHAGKDKFASAPELGPSSSLTPTTAAGLVVPTKIKLARAIRDIGQVAFWSGFGIILVLQGIPVKQQKEDAPLSTAAALYAAAALSAITVSLVGMVSASVAQTTLNRFENPKMD